MVLAGPSEDEGGGKVRVERGEREEVDGAAVGKIRKSQSC